MKHYTLVLFILSQTLGFSQSKEFSIKETIKSAHTTALKFAEKESVPGMAISVSKNGKLLWSEGFGYSNLEENVEVSPSVTQFRIASISKSLTAVALAKLMDDGKLDLDESIYTYIPDFPKKKYDFTVRQVGGHIAGIRHYNGSEFIMNKKMSIVEGLDIFKDSPLKFEPGTNYSYSTYGWNLLSVVVQNASKVEFNQYMTHNVFKPLGMSNTTLDLSDQDMPNRTLFYNKTNAGDIRLGPEVSNEFKAAGGGFVSTSEDLIKFGNEIISPTIFSKASINELLKEQYLTNGKGTGYGVGFGIGKTKNGTVSYSHSGGGIGATTLLLMYPEEEIVIAIVTNLSSLPIRDFGKQLEDIFIN
ncbi:MAG: serine hydrolase domain-containing protein [Flavobacteriaceae bacterium]